MCASHLKARGWVWCLHLCQVRFSHAIPSLLPDWVCALQALCFCQMVCVCVHMQFLHFCQMAHAHASHSLLPGEVCACNSLTFCQMRSVHAVPSPLPDWMCTCKLSLLQYGVCVCSQLLHICQMGCVSVSLSLLPDGV